MTGLIDRLYNGLADIGNGIYNYVSDPSAPAAVDPAVDANDIDGDNEHNNRRRAPQGSVLPPLPRASNPYNPAGQGVDHAAQEIGDAARYMNNDVQNNLQQVDQALQNGQTERQRAERIASLRNRMTEPQKAQVKKLLHQSDDLEQEILSLRAQIETVNAAAQRISN
ncbi:MAG TPA: hypothetical protein VN457_07535, partial [Chlamydiales bacterium]|nr:hypothetical protein [Chlamydiales bacterium]